VAKERDKLGTPCPSCKTGIPFGSMRCPNPKCGEWNFAASDKDNEQEVVRLSDARISIVPRIPTFHPEIDKFFGGGGVVQTSTMLLGAEPGFGKSSFVLQLADGFIQHFIKTTDEKRNVVLVANEQSPDEIRAKAIELGIVHMHEICVVKAMGGFSGNLFEIISRYKPCFTVIDSLSKLVGRDPDLAVIVAAMMKELSVKLNMPTFMINQVTKDLNHAGQEKLQHEVDMTALGSTLGNKRILESEKNRNGQAPLALGMEMKGPEAFAAGKGGLTILGMVAPQDEEEGGDDEPVNRLGEDGTEPGPRRLKK
jgi:DNA repair protein RadA/Sms